tara:strand:+ start:304 stop:633 length:330 start_codon:yes stop_codon:yes gene_type:complete
MSLTSLINDNLKFAIAQVNVSLTTEPSNGETFSANKQDVETGFDIFEDGREETIDTKFYIAKGETQDSSLLPSKGTILTDGTTKYKVMSFHDDAVGVTRRLDCASEFQR